MSAPSRRPFQSMGGGRSPRVSSDNGVSSLRSTADHGAEDDAPPLPGRRSSNAVKSSSAGSPHGNNAGDDLVLGWDHRMTTEERRRMRRKSEAKSVTSMDNHYRYPGERTSGRSSASYSGYGDAPRASSLSRKISSPRVSSSGTSRSRQRPPSIQEDDTFGGTPSITPHKGIPEDSSVRYDRKVTRSRSGEGSRRRSSVDTGAGTSYSRSTLKTSNRDRAGGSSKVSRSDEDFGATEKRERRERERERYGVSGNSEDSLGVERKQPSRRVSDSSVDEIAASRATAERRERRRSSTDIPKEARRRTRSGDELTPEQIQRRLQREKLRRDKTDGASVRSSVKKYSRPERVRDDPSASPRLKSERKDSREKSRDDATSPRTKSSSRRDASSVSTRTKTTRTRREKSREKGREESRRSLPATFEEEVRRKPPPPPGPIGEAPSSAQITARNRLRERMMGDLDSPIGSSRDRSRSGMSMDATRKKISKTSSPEKAEKKRRSSRTEASSRRIREHASRGGEPRSDPSGQVPKRTSSRISSAGRTRSGSRDQSIATSHDDDELLDELLEDSTTESSSDNDSSKEQWSVRVCVLSAVDLPSSVVPNIPLCPVFKFGLVTTPAGEDAGEDTAKSRLSVLSDIEKTGLTAISKSRVRCTSTKILSKRDNGAVEFHEEMRWDKVKRPHRTAIAVELCARAVLPPTNADESPVVAVNEQGLSSQWSTDSPEKRDTNSGGPEKPGFGMAFRSKSVTAGMVPASDDSSTGGIAGMRAFWRKGRQQLSEQRQSGQGEMEAATAAAAVARFLVGGPAADPDAAEGGARSRDSGGDDSDTNRVKKGRMLEEPAGGNVALKQPAKKKRKIEMGEDLRLRSLVIPLTRLPLDKATRSGEAAKIEQWYQMDGSNTSDSSRHWQESQRGPSLQRRNPSILLEITFSPPEVLDKEDEVAHEADETTWGGGPNSIGGGLGLIPEDSGVDHPSMGNLASPGNKAADDKPADPVLEPGVVDFICVVGARDIGNQANDNGAKGWVNTTPDYTLLERFPKTDEFHMNNGRMTALPDKIEWFCFPDGCKLWRGVYPPTHNDLNLKRYSASSPPNVASSMAAFDTCLNCTTSFTWWLLSSTSDNYGSKNKKTYGACIRFYAPAPTGIDPKQDDFAQSVLGGETIKRRPGAPVKRLWVPLGICLVSTLPIVGVMESMLLRICEELSSRAGSMNHTTSQHVVSILHQDLANLIVNFQRPVAGVLHCSIPFLQGERLHLTLPPISGLPPLPHGAAVTMVCRLLGAEGLNVMLAAVLTECKILVHSDDISNLPMVAEVLTALIYPFDWALPYIPVLPDTMLEFVEAPLSYFLGIPTCSLKHVDPSVLSDVVVIDLDNGFSSPDYFDGRRAGKSTKVPTALPASVASNISKAVFRLLREEEEVEEQYGAISFPGSRSMPRLESESLAEREFRIAVALQISGLVRGYQECLIFVSASQPVFNRDRFLRNAPALFEDRRGNLPAFANPVDGSSGAGGSQRMLSPRSKRFLSLLVNTQHFHGLLECLDNDDLAFFHEVMDTFDMSDDLPELQSSSGALSGYGSTRLEKAASKLSKTLQKVEDKVPTYRVDRKGKRDRRGADEWEDDGGHKAFENFLDGNESVCFVNDTMAAPFTNDLLQQVLANESKDDDSQASGESGGGVHSVSIEYMVKLEKNPWSYRKCFEVPMGDEEGDQDEVKNSRPRIKPAKATEVREKVKLRDAIGERRYRAWKVAQEQKQDTSDDCTVLPAVDVRADEGQNALDLTSLLSSAADAMRSDASSPFASFNSKRAPSGLSAKEQRVADAKDRDVLRRCLEQGEPRRLSRSGRKATSDSNVEGGRDLLSEAEKALRNPSAQLFLISVLSQRARIEDRKKRHFPEEASRNRQANQPSVSRLQASAFECLVRLCCAMLGACMEERDYEPAYRLLTETAGFCTVQSNDGEDAKYGSPVKESEDAENMKIIFMTARIGLHPIFADLRLWETVMALHLQDRQNEKNGTRSGSNSGISTPTDSLSGSGTSNKLTPDMVNNGKDSREAAEYEAAVATLYEMLGFGIPAEELARFAGRVSEKYGWFSTERGHTFLMLARRLSVRRDEVEDGAGTAGDLDMLEAGASRGNVESRVGGGIIDDKIEWSEVGWCHPAAGTSRPSMLQDDTVASKVGSPRSRRSGGYESLDSLGADEGESEMDGSPGRGSTSSKPLSRTPITSIASFGSTVIASGGIDGSVFLAHTINFGRDDEGRRRETVVRGVRLVFDDADGQNGGDPSSVDGEGGVGAISCLAAAKGAGYRPGHVLRSDQSDEEELLSAMEGCRIIAGTTSGALRVWSVKEVYAAAVDADSSGSEGLSSAFSDMKLSSGSVREGISSTLRLSKNNTSETPKLDGYALSGHRGGVTCIDAPSHVYRPDTLISGGVDGLIKLWSLRNQKQSNRRNSGDAPSASGRMFGRNANLGSPGVDLGLGADGGADALSVMTGHGGRVMCVRPAWHGDRLVSGGADKTVRFWDIAGSGGKCINTLTGHAGWVTQAHYWGPHTVVSASTDRSVALWDIRSKTTPLFVLRYHRSPITDLLVGSRTDPLIVSSAGDGTVATWDFRMLSGGSDSKKDSSTAINVFRQPLATMSHCAESKKVACSGGVLLSRGPGARNSTAIGVGVDAMMKEWDIATGKLLRHEPTKHCDVVSTLTTLTESSRRLGGSVVTSGDGSSAFGGVITSSWDGTVRMRHIVGRDN